MPWRSRHEHLKPLWEDCILTRKERTWAWEKVVVNIGAGNAYLVASKPVEKSQPALGNWNSGMLNYFWLGNTLDPHLTLETASATFVTWLHQFRRTVQCTGAAEPKEWLSSCPQHLTLVSRTSEGQSYAPSNRARGSAAVGSGTTGTCWVIKSLKIFICHQLLSG